jgi:formylglycine-generating enzyme required for sulfatase activity
MPVNCISLALAEQVCMRLAKRLPTEAQWEFAAGNREQETPFPWGADGDVCAHARIGWGVGPPNEDSSCAAPTSPTGPTPEGHVGDKTELGIANMAGNLSEWVRGYIAPYDAPCWNPSARLLLDPWCDDPASGLWAARGDAYAYAPYLAPIVFRNPMVGSAGSATVGLRCARTWN